MPLTRRTCQSSTRRTQRRCCSWLGCGTSTDCHLSPHTIPPELKSSCLRVFNCYKSASVDRQIGDRRGRNQLEAFLPGLSRSLPTGPSLSVLEVDPTRQRLSICLSDRKDFYHQFRVPPSRARANALWPPFDLDEFQGTQAYAKLLADHAASKTKKPREAVGDFLGGDHANSGGKHLPAKVYACFASVIQGDHLGVEIATQSHRNMLRSRGLLCGEEEITSTFRDRCLQGLIIDDFFSVSVEDLPATTTRAPHLRCTIPTAPKSRPATPLTTIMPPSRSKQRLKVAQQAYAQEGLLGSKEKDIVDEEVAKVAGAELDGSQTTRALGLCTVAAPASKRLGLSFLSLQLASMKATTDALHACLVGGWTSCLMYRRPLMSILDKVHSFIDMSRVNQASPKVLRLSRPVAQEFTLLGILAPLVCSDISAQISTSVFASDASDTKGAIVQSTVEPGLARGFWRTGKKKGGYTRLLSREQALLSKIDSQFEEVPAEDPLRHPSKPLALRYHFIEICGGAGKVTKFADKEGLTVGPVIDLDRSPAFDFCLIKLFSWLCFMVESGRLDSFLLAPPCTTFSPAAYPCLRSYRRPRGFRPSERRTLLGTTLALRSLALMLVASRTQVIGLLETPRRSKMAWLREWIYFLESPVADETWLASCNFSSPHQKEFRLLGCNIEMSRFNFPCTRDHTHVKIEGKFTKPSATYTDDLAWFFASEIARAVNIKLRRQQDEDVQVGGLESVLSNDISENLEWKTMQEWRWKKKEVHINMKETSAFGRLAYWLARHSPKTRFSAGLDSFVAISAIIKGRSASYGLRPALRRIGATLIAGCLYPALHFFPTRSNKADHPTRDSEIPDPVPCSVLRSRDLQEAVSLARIPDLKRFAANWTRLVLLLLGGPPKWFRSKDSWRFQHYISSAYPIAFSSRAARKLRHDGFDFDASLGFPGEGPLLGLYPFVFFVGLTFCCNPDFIVWGLCGLFVRGFVLPVGPVPCLFCRPLCLSVCIVKVCSKDLSHLGAWAAPPVPSHGNLLPRDKGDENRMQLRKGVVLDEGRPVLGRTKNSRDKLLQTFDGWLQTQGFSLESLLDPKTLDIETINLVLERYGRALYHGGRPYGHYSETVNAIGARRPNLRRMLQGAWNLAFTWLREEPPVHHVALPWQVLAAMISVSYLWGWNRTAGVLALSWGALTRIGEVLKACRRHLVLPRDLSYTIKYAPLQIEEPKTRFRSARHQVARLDQPQLLHVVELSFQDLKADDPLWGFSPQTLRSRFQKLLAALRLDVLPRSVSRGLDLGSLRAGGASWMMLVSEDSELVRRRGRWLTSKIMEIYVQEVSAIQFLPQLPQSTRDLVIEGTGLFPLLLERAISLHACGIPESAWKYLLVEGRMNAEYGRAGGWHFASQQWYRLSCTCETSFEVEGKKGRVQRFEMLTFNIESRCIHGFKLFPPLAFWPTLLPFYQRVTLCISAVVQAELHLWNILWSGRKKGASAEVWDVIQFQICKPAEVCEVWPSWLIIQVKFQGCNSAGPDTAMLLFSRCDWWRSWPQQCSQRATLAEKLWCWVLTILTNSSSVWLMANSKFKTAIFWWNKFSTPPEGNVIWAWMRALKCLEPLLSEASFRNGHLTTLEVLKRMCRSLYRYPDPEAAEVAKKTLEEIRPMTASMEIEVVKCPECEWIAVTMIYPWPIIPNLIIFDPVCIDTSKML